MDELVFTMAGGPSTSSNSTSNVFNGNVVDAPVVSNQPVATPDPNQPPASEPVNPAPAVPDPAVPPDAPKPPEETYEDWTQAGKLGLSLKALDLFQELEITKDDDFDSVLSKVNTLYSTQIETERERLKSSYDTIVQYVDELQGRADNEFIQSLAPMRTIIELPLAVNETITDDIVLQNARELVKFHFTELLKSDELAESNVALLESNKTLLPKALEIQQQIKSQHDSIITQKLANDKAVQDAEIAAEQEKLQKLNDSVKQILTVGKIFDVPLPAAEVATINEALYGKPSEVMVIKELDETGKVVEKQIMVRKAEKAFAEFWENPEMQLWFLRQYIRGDFADGKIAKQKEIKINNALKDDLNSRINVKTGSEPKTASTVIGQF